MMRLQKLMSLEIINLKLNTHKNCLWPLCREKRLIVVFGEVRTGGSCN